MGFGKVGSNGISSDLAPRIRTFSEVERRSRGDVNTPLLPRENPDAPSDAELRAASGRRLRRALIVTTLAAGVVAAVAYAAFTVVLDDDASDAEPNFESPSRLLLRRLVNDTTAKCLDGGPSGYYYRAGTDDTWVIYLQGGGICMSSKDCIGRARTSLGSSASWSDYRNDDGILNHRDGSNPFRNSTHVFIPYCGGDAHTGEQKSPNAYGLYHAGYLTVMAVIADLKATRGFGRAANVLVTGDSAGGLGAFMNVDYVADAVPNATVKASPLGGLYFAANISNYTEWLNGTEDGNFDRYLANELHKLYDSKLHPGCVAQHDGDESDCGSVGVMARYIESPLLISENLYDSDKLSRLGRPRDGGGVVNFTQYYGERAAASVQISIDDSAVGASHGYFLPACGDHVSNLGIQSPVRIAVNASTTLRLNYSQVLDYWFFDHNGTFPSRIMDACARVTGGPCGQC